MKPTENDFREVAEHIAKYTDTPCIEDDLGDGFNRDFFFRDKNNFFKINESIIDDWFANADSLDEVFTLAEEYCDFNGFLSLPFHEVDRVNHPAHYNNAKYECIDVMEETFGTEEVKIFCKLNAFKYLWRAEHKNGTEDMRKAKWYLDKYIELS